MDLTIIIKKIIEAAAIMDMTILVPFVEFSLAKKTSDQ